MFPSRRASLKVFSTGFTNIYLVRFGIFLTNIYLVRFWRYVSPRPSSVLVKAYFFDSGNNIWYMIYTNVDKKVGWHRILWYNVKATVWWDSDQRCIFLETDVLKMFFLGFLLSLVLLGTVYHPGQFFSDGWPREAGSGSGSGRTCFSWKLWSSDMTMIDKPANDVLPACWTAIHLEKSFCDWCRFFVTDWQLFKHPTASSGWKSKSTSAKFTRLWN